MESIINDITQLIGNYVPNLLGAIAILVIGWIVASIISKVVKSILKKIRCLPHSYLAQMELLSRLNRYF